MSKASEFATRLQFHTVIEVAERPVFKGQAGKDYREIAGVSNTGGCYLKSLYIEREVALKLARWILDTFGEAQP